jgi:hypothetical protein
MVIFGYSGRADWRYGRRICNLLASDNNDNGAGIAALCCLWPIGLPLGILTIRIYCELLIPSSA